MMDIPEKSLREAIKQTGARTKRDAVVTAVGRFSRRRRLEEMAQRLHGSMPNFMTQEDLNAMRVDDNREKAK